MGKKNKSKKDEKEGADAPPQPKTAGGGADKATTSAAAQPKPDAAKPQQQQQQQPRSEGGQHQQQSRQGGWQQQPQRGQQGGSQQQQRREGGQQGQQGQGQRSQQVQGGSQQGQGQGQWGQQRQQGGQGGSQQWQGQGQRSQQGQGGSQQGQGQGQRSQQGQGGSQQGQGQGQRSQQGQGGSQQGQGQGQRSQQGQGGSQQGQGQWGQQRQQGGQGGPQQGQGQGQGQWGQQRSQQGQGQRPQQPYQGQQGQGGQGQRSQQGHGGQQQQQRGPPQYQQRGPPPTQQQQQGGQSGALPPGPVMQGVQGNIKRGTIGRPGNVSVNYLTVDMAKMPSVAYHYDVTINPERPKKFYRPAFEQYRTQYLKGCIAAFDGRKSCYSVDKIPLVNGPQEVEVVDVNGRTLKYTVEVKATDTMEVDLESLRNYMTSKIYDKPMRALQCLEVVLASPCHNSSIRAGRSFFKRSQGEAPKKLGDGYEMLVGLYQSFVLGDKPFVNVDISHKSFPMEMPVVSYLEEYILNARIDQRATLSDFRSRNNIINFIKAINVVYEPPKCFNATPRMYKVNGLTQNGAAQEKFTVDNVTMTVAEYFKKRGYPLQYPNLPCLHVGPPAKNIYLPMELCKIEGGQALLRKDGANQVSEMIRYAATSTNERKDKIINLLQYFKHNLDPTISRFGIQIGNNFIVVPTRLLNAPMLEYKGSRTANVRNGSWRMDQYQFLSPKPVKHKWAVLHCENMKMSYQQVDGFASMVSQHARNLDVGLEPKPEIRSIRDEKALDIQFQELKANKCDLVFVILPNYGVTYDTIKQKAELQHGILTQCIKHNNVVRRLNAQLVTNVLLKVNSKLNGTNHKIKDDFKVKLDNVMYLGADVTHPSPDQREIPSVVGVAASHDRFGACYNMQYRLQRSTVENIEDMESITSEHLRIYKQYQNRYPEHIIYYRDGVSDGQFPIVRNHELRGIKNACAKLKCEPKLCCVIVVKRHHTRFFPDGQPSQYNKFNNVDPGTIVDRVIVHPNEMQFFMVSHQSIQGTAKPTRYNVIENTGNLDIDFLQQLTYNMCHMFPRCNRAVSYPAPAYLAHLVAARGRVYLTGTRNFRTPLEEYKKRIIVPEFMKSNPMYFV